MKLKVDKEGKVVVEDEKPVFIDEDGKEIVVDVPQLFVKIKELNGESKQRRLELGDLKKRYKIFEDVEDLEEYKTGADKAVELAKNIDESQLMQAGKVEELKSSMKAAFEDERVLVAQSFENEKKDLVNQISTNEQTIFNLLVTSKFDRSPYFSGENPKTNVLPDMAAKYFGHQLKVEKDKDGKLKVVGYNRSGAPIYSRKSPGELADFDEAIGEIIDEYPMKDRILKVRSGGSGGKGGGSDFDEGDELSKLKAQYKEAIKGGTTVQAIALKNQIFRLENK